MILWLWRLIVGCNHDYRHEYAMDAYRYSDYTNLKGRKTVYRCTKCHKTKVEKDY